MLSSAWSDWIFELSFQIQTKTLLEARANIFVCERRSVPSLGAERFFEPELSSDLAVTYTENGSNIVIRVNAREVVQEYNIPSFVKLRLPRLSGKSVPLRFQNTAGMLFPLLPSLDCSQWREAHCEWLTALVARGAASRCILRWYSHVRRRKFIFSRNAAAFDSIQSMIVAKLLQKIFCQWKRFIERSDVAGASVEAAAVLLTQTRVFERWSSAYTMNAEKHRVILDQLECALNRRMFVLNGNCLLKFARQVYQRQKVTEYIGEEAVQNFTFLRRHTFFLIWRAGARAERISRRYDEQRLTRMLRATFERMRTEVLLRRAGRSLLIYLDSQLVDLISHWRLTVRLEAWRAATCEGLLESWLAGAAFYRARRLHIERLSFVKKVRALQVPVGYSRPLLGVLRTLRVSRDEFECCDITQRAGTRLGVRTKEASYFVGAMAWVFTSSQNAMG